MRARLLLFLASILVVGLVLWALVSKKHPGPVKEETIGQTEPQTTFQSPQDSAVQPAASSKNEAVPEPGALPAAKPDSDYVRYYREQTKLDRTFDWKQPINFYGKVVDESNQPIAGASIRFTWTDLSPAGTSEDGTTSDSNGTFTLLNRTGKRLSVSASKEGYYATGAARLASFEYANPFDGRFVPDPANPVVFPLRRKGSTEPLFAFKKTFRIPRDGTPVEINLASGKSDSAAVDGIKIECWTKDNERNQSHQYDWRCRVSVPTGGMIESTNEFPFEAPQEGYQPFDEIDMPASLEQGWKDDVARNYFVKLGDGKYAYIKFRMIAGGDHFFKLESFLNPSRSRNLEYDPTKAIRPEP